MKKLIKLLTIIITLLIFISCTNSQSATPTTLSDKVIIYDIKRKSCPACVYQERVFKVKEVKELLDRYCKVIYVDVSEQDEKLPKEWMKTHKTPTVHFVDSNNNKLIPSIGSVYPYEFRDAILAAHKELEARRGK